MEEGEMGNFVKVWTWVFLCLCYCYIIGKIVPKGFFRLLTVLPVICIFFLLPLSLTSVHLGGTTAFFIAWLANFKLLLFAFALGPLASDPSISIGRFIVIACLPIKISQSNQPPKSSPDPQEVRVSRYSDGVNEHSSKRTSLPNARSRTTFLKWILNYGTKGLVFAVLLKIYDYSDSIHPKLLLLLYSIHIYITLEATLVLAGVLAKALLRLELEPQFEEPYLSSSLQDFWGHRWNIMVSKIMRPTVYHPILQASAQVVGRKWAPIPAVFGTFVVSALMHELIYYYLGRMRPTWEITFFFLLHGMALSIEIAIKKRWGSSSGWQLPRFMAGPLTVSFVMVTGFWLFFPQMLRFKADVRAFEEYEALGDFVKHAGNVIVSKFTNITSASW